MDVFIILQLSRSVHMRHKQFSGNNKQRKTAILQESSSNILTLLILLRIDAKSAAPLKVPPLAKVVVRNPSLLHFSRQPCSIHGQRDISLQMRKGQLYVNVNASVSSILKNRQFYYKCHCHRNSSIEEF